MARRRLVELLVEQGLCTDHDRARRLVMAGEVVVDGRVAITPGALVSLESSLHLRPKPLYVSRGGLKLEAALNAFHLELHDRVIADVGASTGGFTDCVLQRRAARVYAIDVAKGALAWSLRTDPRVVALEGINVMHLDELPEAVDLVTVDLSFTSLRLVLPKVSRWLKPEGDVIVLIKPQYEVDSLSQLIRGIVVDPVERRRIVGRLLRWMKRQSWDIEGLITSPIRGSGGNWEYLTHLRQGSPGSPLSDLDITEIVASVIPV